jgi:hypothetical protein
MSGDCDGCGEWTATPITRGVADPTIQNWRNHYEAIMKTVGLDTLLEIMRRTVDK